MSIKNNTIFHRSYKKLDNENFKRQLDSELLNIDINKIEFKTMHNIFMSVLNSSTPLKQNHLPASHAAFDLKSFHYRVTKRFHEKDQTQELFPEI